LQSCREGKTHEGNDAGAASGGAAEDADVHHLGYDAAV